MLRKKKNYNNLQCLKTSHFMSPHYGNWTLSYLIFMIKALVDLKIRILVADVARGFYFSFFSSQKHLVHEIQIEREIYPPPPNGFHLKPPKPTFESLEKPHSLISNTILRRIPPLDFTSYGTQNAQIS